MYHFHEPTPKQLRKAQRKARAVEHGSVDQPQRTSRRRILTGIAVVAVGWLATAAVSVAAISALPDRPEITTEVGR